MTIESTKSQYINKCTRKSQHSYTLEYRDALKYHNRFPSATTVKSQGNYWDYTFIGMITQ